MECQICYNKTIPSKTMIVLHDSHHKVCPECYTKLRQNKITRCPFCRERINKDIVETSSDTLAGTQPSPRYVHRIDADRLLTYGISQKFIETISDILPFSYTSRFEGIDFIVETKRKYEEWVKHNVNTPISNNVTIQSVI